MLHSDLGSFDSVRLRLTALRCNENKKSVPPRVEYVLEAQALKEARDDPRWRRSSPEILLHDGAGSKREDFTGGCRGGQGEGSGVGCCGGVCGGREGGGGGGGCVRGRE